MYMMYIASATKKMIFKKFKRFLFENYHQRMRFAKEELLFNKTSEEKDLQLFATKLT